MIFNLGSVVGRVDEITKVATVGDAVTLLGNKLNSGAAQFSNIRNSAIGAAGGAALGFLFPGKDEKGRKKGRLWSATKGAGVGAVGGLIVGKGIRVGSGLMANHGHLGEELVSAYKQE